MKSIERLRWWIADRMNKRPDQCWADLVSWVLADRRERRGWYLRERLPWRPIQKECRDDFKRVGACYCGRLREKEGGS